VIDHDGWGKYNVWCFPPIRLENFDHDKEYTMTTQPQTDTPAAAISSQTERVLHDFVLDAVTSLAKRLKDSPPEFEDIPQWNRGADGHFRESSKRMPHLWPVLTDQWLLSLPHYQSYIECLKSDVVIGRHLDTLVGTTISASRLEANNILTSFVYVMIDEAADVQFSEDKFNAKWKELASFFLSDWIVRTTVAPLPHLSLPFFPLQLNNQLLLDRLTDEEVTRCHQAGVIRPVSLRFPLIFAYEAVGIRTTVSFPKRIGSDAETQKETKAEIDEGTFGNRPHARDDLVVDDILSALRLFKNTQIRSSGLVSWTASPCLGTVMSYRVLGQWPYGGKFELSEEEVPRFLELWNLLEQEAVRFGFSIHRFNLAFDRGLLVDKIVDLVIAAETLFLSDMDEKSRGELRYRFALRGAKFIQHPKYGEHDVFLLMRRAYDARSAIVHGGSPSDTRLPDNQSSNLPTFIETVEELVRLGLRKALSMKEDGSKLKQSAYWDSLIFQRN
jgi:hypothetical protein